jgi:hypothetical protein
MFPFSASSIGVNVTPPKKGLLLNGSVGKPAGFPTEPQLFFQNYFRVVVFIECRNLMISVKNQRF